MTNEALVIEIQAGRTDLISTLWEQVEKFTIFQANRFYNKHYERCVAVGVELADLRQEAYLGIYNAIWKYNNKKDVKFLTYANYHLMKQFYKAAGMHTHNWENKPEPISLETTVATFENEDVKIIDIMPDKAAETEMNDVIENEYINEVKPILQRALDRLPNTQKETVLNCVCKDISYAEYGRQRGVGRVTIRQSAERALRNLRNDLETAACFY